MTIPKYLKTIDQTVTLNTKITISYHFITSDLKYYFIQYHPKKLKLYTSWQMLIKFVLIFRIIFGELKMKEPKRTMALAMWDGALFHGFLVTTQGLIMIAICRYLNTSIQLMALLSSIPVIAQMVQILTPKLLRHLGSRKKAITACTLGARFPFILLPLAVFFEWKGTWIIFSIIISFSIFSSLINNIWTSGMRDIVAPEKRGMYFSSRAVFSAAMAMIFTQLYSFIIDPEWLKILFAKPWMQNFSSLFQDYTIEKSGFLIMTISVAFFAIITSIFMSGHRFPEKACYRGTKLDLKTPMKDKTFRIFLLFSLAWAFTQEFSRPFPFYYSQEILKIPNSYLGYMNTLTAVLSIGLFPIYGKLSNHFGNRQLLAFGMITGVLNPLLFFFISPENAQIILVLDGITTAISLTAISLAYFNYLLEIVQEPTESYIAIYAFLVGTSALLAGLLGGWLGDVLNQFDFKIMDHSFHGLKIIFIIAIISRITCFLILTHAERLKQPIVYARPVLTFLGVFRAREIFLGFYGRFTKKK